VDGIALDAAGNIWADPNERNAIVVVTKKGEVVEVFRNPANSAGLRNEGPLETPTSPFLLGHKFCTANSDGNRRDNSPSTAGEIAPGAAFQGKISCMDQPLKIPACACRSERSATNKKPRSPGLFFRPVADQLAVSASSVPPPKLECTGVGPPLVTFTAQYLNSGILPTGSSFGLVSMFAAAS